MSVNSVCSISHGMSGISHGMSKVCIVTMPQTVRKQIRVTPNIVRLSVVQSDCSFSPLLPQPQTKWLEFVAEAGSSDGSQ